MISATAEEWEHMLLPTYVQQYFYGTDMNSGQNTYTSFIVAIRYILLLEL